VLLADLHEDAGFISQLNDHASGYGLSDIRLLRLAAVVATSFFEERFSSLASLSYKYALSGSYAAVLSMIESVFEGNITSLVTVVFAVKMLVHNVFAI
jgi:hypothetical protein